MEKIKKTRIVLTGFGPFPGVPKNPTETLLGMIQKEIKRDDVEFDVFEVSAKGSTEQLERLRKIADAETIWIHLGVNMGIHRFNLEEKAYNCANFRCPDQRGALLKNEKIVKTDSDAMKTSLPLEDICGQMVSLGHDVTISQDAGRYLCNYVYMKSLYYCRKKYSHGKCVFVHVPSFRSISLEKQCKFILDLADALLLLNDDDDDDDDDDNDDDMDDNDDESEDDLHNAAPLVENKKTSFTKELAALISMGFRETQSREALKLIGNLEGDVAVQRAAIYLMLQQQQQQQQHFNDSVKMVILVRMDLKLSKGKIGSQCSHAALDAYRRIGNDREILKAWSGNGEKIVVLRVSNQIELEKYAHEAYRASLPVSVICDAGRTEVASGTKTVVAIGPAHSSKIDNVTGNLKLL